MTRRRRTDGGPVPPEHEVEERAELAELLLLREDLVRGADLVADEDVRHALQSDVLAPRACALHGLEQADDAGAAAVSGYVECTSPLPARRAMSAPWRAR